MNHRAPSRITADPVKHQALSGPMARAYARFRPGVPDEVAWLLADAMTGVPAVTLLDLGAGTGQVAAAVLPALPRTRQVDLVDPSWAMLREAALTLHPLMGECALACHETPAEHYGPHQPVGYQADLITCARAFHRMDRAAVLAMAERIAAPHTVIALLDDGPVLVHRSEWTGALRDLIQSYLGPGHRPRRPSLRSGQGLRYEDELAGSAFGDVSRHLFRFPRAWTPREVIGYLRTRSGTRPELFGERHAAFETEAARLLETYADGGQVTEQVDFTVLLARRPGDAR
ncbi:class I SAM-dependent methyltransferase [Streptomyces aureus]|uniref:class I SAM-dependent methyltransferase n=1 Tax=Streptomyces aureus TaxID=193461 RepID=UPI000AFB5A30|nr:class I SAM-dependent methyltransferase [Streptomyces aureus]